MKTPIYFRPTALLVLAGGLILPLAAQKEPDAPGAAQISPPNQTERPAPAPDEKARESDAGGASRPDVSRAPVDDFARADTDRDGRVSPKEYAASDVAAIDMTAAGKRSGSEAPRGGFDLHNNEGNPQRSSFFRRLDTNKDGYLSREEFASDNRGGTKKQK